MGPLVVDQHLSWYMNSTWKMRSQPGTHRGQLRPCLDDKTDFGDPPWRGSPSLGSRGEERAGIDMKQACF